MEININPDISDKKLTAEEVVIEVMRHHGFRRNYQVAKYFNVTPQTLSGWIKNGNIPLKHYLKFYNDIAKKNKINNNISDNENQQNNSYSADGNFTKRQIEEVIFKNIKYIFLIPTLICSLVSIYVFVFANEVYTSESKVLPVSEDGNTASNFSGFASQLGINIPLNIGGKVPWDEIYPEILKSSDLMVSMLSNKYLTEKYGDMTLNNILINEHNLSDYKVQDQTNRLIGKLRDMIFITKDRSSPIVKIDVAAFEPVFAANLAKDLILRSSVIQRELKTNRVRQKRLFIEDRLEQVLLDMKNMERDLRSFRENNRNLSSSPSLQMRVQEMGRERDLQNSLYVTLKTQYEKAKIDEVGRDDMVQQIDGPSIPTKLTSPKRLLSISMSLVFGIFLSIFFIYFKEKYSSFSDSN